MRYLFVLLFVFVSFNISAQFITSLDTVLCSSQDITLTASGANISPSFINTDDIHSEIIPMGFDFDFYGNTYNECVISANGYITFDLTQEGVYSPWAINNAIPNPNNLPENAIMAPWHDIDPGVGGAIVYGTYGAAPNRVFYVVWCSMPMFSCNDLIVGQYALLFETSNKIQMHLDEKPLCVNWNGGAAIQGLVNENSTLFEIVDDPVLAQPRNFPLQWDANDEGWEFEPNADFTDYTVSEIPYSPIATGTVTWTDQYGNVLGEDLNLTVTPDTGAVYYYITVVDVCTGEVIPNVDSVLVQTFAQTNAGLVDVPTEDSTVFLCDVTDGADFIDLNNYLGDDYQDDGFWFSEDNTQIPAQQSLVESSTGDYSYITYGVNDLCNDTSFINLFVNKLPDAGEIGFKLVCSGDPTFDMFNELTGSPQAGGAWYDPVFDSVPSIFDPFTSEVGIYTYIVEGVNACPSDSQILSIDYQQGFEINTYSTPVTCFGYDNGSITMFAENNTVNPITFSIDGGQTFNEYNSFENLQFGTYNVSVKDGNGCITEEEVTVSAAQAPISVLATSTDALCNGDNTASVSVSSISGGNISTNGYSYTWFNSGTNEVVGTDSSVFVPAGGYYLIVEDDNGCQGTDEVSVEQPNQITYDIIKQDISCKGNDDGFIQVQVTGGGVPPYNFNWTSQGNSASSVLNNLTAGTYDLEISDLNNCVSYLSIELTEPALPLSITLSNVDVSCFGEQSGSASVSVSGGTPPYSYEWSSGHVTNEANQLPSGLHTVRVTDFSGCEVVDTIEVLENNEILISTTTSLVSCYGFADGSASVTASGGTGVLDYTWSTGATTTTILNQPYGDYWVKVEDSLGCIVIDSLLIDQPSPLKAQLVSNDVKCFGGSDGEITSTVSGGTPSISGYNYNWSINGNSFGNSNGFVNGLPFSTSPYLMTVTDSLGCQVTVLAYVNEPSELVLDTSEIVSAYCLNIPSGDASVVASGGFLNTDGSYSFSWNTGDTTSLISDKVAGAYTVVVEDDNACTDTLSLEIPLVETFALTMTSDSLNCFEDASGSATVVSVGGYGPYTYDWNTPLGASQQSSSFNTNTITSLPAGVTSVVVTDINGCAKTTQTLVVEPSELLFSIFKNNDESCSGDVSSCDGEIELIATGGVGNFTFAWESLDGSVLNSITTSSSTTISDLCSGFYQLTVEDERGCVGVSSGSGIPSPVEIIAGTPVESAINTSSGSITNSIVCYGDTSAILSVSNSNPSYNYQWYVDGEYITSGLTATLPAGDISVRAVSLSDTTCYTNSDVVTIYQPSEITIEEEVTSVSCNGGSDGSVSIDAFGGNPDYSYSWSLDGSLLGDGTALSSLSTGTYVLSITDASNCVRSFDLEITEPSLIEGVATVSDVQCNGESDGSASVTVTGGVAPHYINWGNSDSTALGAGTYTVVLSDANACEVNLSVEVDEPSALQANFSVSSIPFTATASGGTPNYSYEWLYFGNYQSSGTSFTPDLSGEYTLVVTDANDCEKRVTRDYTKVDVDEFSSMDVLIYPNPAREYFTVELMNSNDEEYTFKLMDSRARVLRESKFTNSLVIERGDLASGIYFIFVENETKSIRQKILFAEKK